MSQVNVYDDAHRLARALQATPEFVAFRLAAGREAFHDLDRLVDPYAGSMNSIVMAADGRHAAFSNVETATYIYMTGEMNEPEERPRIYVVPAVPLP